MIPYAELGHFALIIAGCFALLLATCPMLGSVNGNSALLYSARALSLSLFGFLCLSFAALAMCFLQDDFSVAYVLANSNTALPDYFKFSAVWSAHEGSLLLWALIQGGWICAVALFSAHLPPILRARVLSVMGMVMVGFLLFLLFTSNPFTRELPFHEIEGRDLNPLLQDFGLIVHPPILYCGYVGFSVAFAFAIAALVSGQVDAAWARWVRPWTSAAWMFMTIGIALGSWWAYYELGWGGWWFWDPVENASLMPWLAGTALLHSLAVTEKRGLFRSWTLLLAIFAFSLSLLGTFLVRSGVLTSVHAFAADPTRGYFILTFLSIVIGGSLVLFALRAPLVRNVVSFEWLSREFFLLANNVLLVIMLGVVLLGTLYPLVMDALKLGKVSVGPPWFNIFFMPLMGILLVLLPIGAFLPWKRVRREKLRALLWLPLLAVIGGIGFAQLAGGRFVWQAALGCAVALWVVLGTASDMVNRVRHANNYRELRSRLPNTYLGMVLAHIGMAVTALGVVFTASFSEQRDVRMVPGQSDTLLGYEFHFDKIEDVSGANYQATRVTFTVLRDAQVINTLHGEKRRYNATRQVMTEAGILPGFLRDLYVSPGEPLEGDAWAIRLQVKPYVRWVWCGSILMALGALLAMLDRRYRFDVATTAAVTEGAQP